MITHKITYRVIYGDTDNMGIAYYSNYLRWFEMGRTEFFRYLGLTYKEIEERGIFLPVSEVYCKYLYPVHYDDVLIIETSLDTSVKASMKFNYLILSKQGNTILAKGKTRHAFTDYNGRVVRPPELLMELIAKNNKTT
ncbi:MAG: acyl-CoA thioesterase [Desulfobacteraceae bacterium]|nr:acyl-CoA thioesterase [Desulfobacteraceae bacterium]MBC2719609.1 acyl-CoA thioesterase [Desulfobacteraceae bacterium]